jgi:hypothetical protein
LVILAFKLIQGVILTGCIGLIAAIALCFGGYKETWKINWIGDALLILAALIQFGFGISAVYHYSHAGDDAEVLWDNAPGHVQEAWIQAFSCDIDNIDSCKNSMAQYLKEGYVPFIILFFLSGILCMISAFISFFWIRHLHESKPSPKCASKEAFEVLVLR